VRDGRSRCEAQLVLSRRAFFPRDVDTGDGKHQDDDAEERHKNPIGQTNDIGRVKFHEQGRPRVAAFAPPVGTARAHHAARRYKASRGLPPWRRPFFPAVADAE
jgi:hypothetical protein